MSQEEAESFQEWLKEHDPQRARWLERCDEIDAEVAALDDETLQRRFNALAEELRQQGKIILEAGKDAWFIYELHKQTHSMQAPFCDTSGTGMRNVPDRYVILNNRDLPDRVKELIVAIEYPLFHNK